MVRLGPLRYCCGEDVAHSRRSRPWRLQPQHVARARGEHVHSGAWFQFPGVGQARACAGVRPTGAHHTILSMPADSRSSPATHTEGCVFMKRSRPSTGRSRPIIDRWPWLTAVAAASLAVGSLIVRRAAHSTGQAGNVTVGSEAAEPSEPVTPTNQVLSQAATRLRLAVTAAGKRLSAAGRAAWRELVHADHGRRGGAGAAGAETPAAPASAANAPEPPGSPDHSLHPR